MNKIIFLALLFICLATLNFNFSSATTSCNPSNCASGYSDGGVNCQNSGNSYTCTRTCTKDGRCGTTWSDVQVLSKVFNVDNTDNGQSFMGNYLRQSSSYCYKMRGKSKLEVSNWDPGGVWHYSTNSYTLDASSPWTENSACYGASPGTVQSSWYEIGRGRDGVGSISEGYFIPYIGTDCTNAAYGITGTLTVSLEYQQTSWNPDSTDSKTCTGTICSSHSTKQCGGNSIYWVDSCGEQEELYQQCSSGQDCQNAQCVNTCTEGFVGSKSCNGLIVEQAYQHIDCSLETKQIETCTSPQTCNNGVCQTGSCNCQTPTPWESVQCINNIKTRTNHDCINSQCSAKTETQLCTALTCNSPSQCADDETCSSGVCTKIQCNENEDAVGHVCVPNQPVTLPMEMIIAGLGIVAIIYFVVVRKMPKSRR